MNNQGENSEKTFHGIGSVGAIKLFYGESASLFAKIIRANYKPGKYTLADLGGHKGELLADILKELPEYEFDAIIIDRVAGLDDKNIKTRKIVGNIINSEIANKSIDIVIMRYVLPWDAYDKQKLIIQETQRICRGITIIQHQGAPDDNPRLLQEASLKLWSGIVPVLKRDYGFFTEAKKVEKWMDELNIKYEKIDQKYIETLSEMFIEKFKLNENDANKTIELLKGCDGITITTWLLRFD